MGRLDGRVALITGAGRGQGRSHALTLAREGADIIAFDVPDTIASLEYETASGADLKETVAGVEALGRRILAVEGDARSQQDLDGAVAAGIAELGQVDILVANHGVLSIDPFWEMSEQRWTEMLDVNLSGVWRACKAVAPHMISRQRGAIVMTASINAFETQAGYAHYNASKAGVFSLMKNVAIELGGYGIRANCVCPGATNTRIVDWQGLYDRLLWPGAGAGDLMDATKHWTALRGRKLLDPQSISNAVLWLVSDEAADVTGVALPVDAGHLILPGYNGTPAEI
ncbi:mycofactocin-coupled SDR family oxidoreductase [Pseudonocardia sp. GCM10023141]|uniref:mycofactocin-coupled SDR family oxidoreductase n=1 Tax=Pseudonocardia sp. GCM10023141 TaxID=3252653 RepID=UPI00360762B2